MLPRFSGINCQSMTFKLTTIMRVPIILDYLFEAILTIKLLCYHCPSKNNDIDEIQSQCHCEPYAISPTYPSHGKNSGRGQGC